MGSRAINWCDRCGRESNRLTGYLFGKPSEFEPKRNSVESKNRVALCDECLRNVEMETKLWVTFQYSGHDPRE